MIDPGNPGLNICLILCEALVTRRLILWRVLFSPPYSFFSLFFPFPLSLGYPFTLLFSLIFWGDRQYELFNTKLGVKEEDIVLRLFPDCCSNLLSRLSDSIMYGNEDIGHTAMLLWFPHLPLTLLSEERWGNHNISLLFVKCHYFIAYSDLAYRDTCFFHVCRLEDTCTPLLKFPLYHNVCLWNFDILL